MPGWLRTSFCLAPLFLFTDTQASSVFRCEDANGRITFTQSGCPQDHQQATQRAHNPRPGSGKPVPMADSRTSSKRDSNERNPVIVAEPQDGCGNRVTGNNRRQAIIRKEVRSGMTRADVESSLGKPERITRQGGQERYYYRDNAGNRTQVSFDENGCVKGK